MSLEEIVKTAVGAGASFVIGAAWGYFFARYDESKQARPKEKQKLANIVESAVATFWGILPQNWCDHSSLAMHLASYAGGIVGAFVGKYLGRLLWHKRNDGKPFLNEKEQAEFEELKKRIKQYANDKTYVEFVLFTSAESAKYFATLGIKKHFSPRVEQMRDCFLEEIKKYVSCFYKVKEISTMSQSNVLVREGIGDDVSGKIYIFDQGKLHVYSMHSAGQVISRDDLPFAEISLDPSIDTKEIRDWKGDAMTLAEELVKEQGIVVLIGGDAPFALKEQNAVLAYGSTVANYLGTEHLKHNGNGNSPSNDGRSPPTFSLN